MVCAMLMAASSAFATTYSSDAFNYPNGNLVGNDSWEAHSAAGVTPVQVVNGAIVLNQGAGSREDVDKPFGTQSGALYAAFDVTVSGDNETVYFAHFIDGVSTNFETRIGITASTDGGDFTFGIFSGSTAVAAQFASGFNYNQDYRLVVEYDAATKLSKLWVNPVSESSSSISWTETYNNACNGYAFRQATGSTSSEVIDNLVVASTFNEAASQFLNQQHWLCLALAVCFLSVANN